jgi:hypothetical protein
VFVHTCRCIFLIVLIWFISRRKLFQKSFENVFEVLEKEKEIEIISFSVLGRKPAPLLSFWPSRIPLLSWPWAAMVGR